MQVSIKVHTLSNHTFSTLAIPSGHAQIQLISFHSDPEVTLVFAKTFFQMCITKITITRNSIKALCIYFELLNYGMSFLSNDDDNF